MVLTAIIFFIAAIGAISGAIGVVMLRNPFYSVLSLAIHLVSLAALFLLLRAEFVAAAQVVVYAGAVMVLYVFVVAYVGGGEQLASGGVLRVLGPLFALALAIELCIALLGAGLKGVNTKGAPYVTGFGTPQHIGKLFLTQYLFPFELASILLLVAAVGAVVLARRRRGLEPEEQRIDQFLFRARRPAYTGTMAEGAGIRPTTQDEPYAVEAERVGTGAGESSKPEGGW
ncbi:MAG TPA: NADH-quinone oxidoreductase subunit J [Solirubrobacteraceae bacterium]|nr:NADH-quinone oxidoreductase subunit J [Solirubrobacteraceae bacterium]